MQRGIRLAEKPIQEQFGQRVIDAFADFARSDLKAPAELAADEFSHVTNPDLRQRLAEVFYGVRWIYKLGLAMLTEDTERAAHIRAQIVDYASVSEALLADCLAHAIRNGHTVGTAYTYKDPDIQRQPIRGTRRTRNRGSASKACGGSFGSRVSSALSMQALKQTSTGCASSGTRFTFKERSGRSPFSSTRRRPSASSLARSARRKPGRLRICRTRGAASAYRVLRETR